MELKPLRLVLHPESLDGIGGHCGWRRDVGKRSAVRAPEPESSVGLSIDLIALLVDRAVMPATEQGQVRERGGAAARPVAEVMALAEREPAAREATGPVSMVKGAPQGRGNRPRPGADLHEAPGIIMAHDHAAGVARQALGRFRGNAHAVLEDGLAGLIGVGEHRGINMHHDLVPLSRGARIEAVMQRRLREQGQRIRLLLGHGGRLRGSITG